MTKHQYTLTAQSRISAALGPEKGNHTAVHRVIPGAVVRGAMATEWWRQFGKKTTAAQEFAALFDHGLRVGQAAPAGATLTSASTQVCKYRPKGCEAVVDRAILLAKAIDRKIEHCPTCGGVLTTDAGWHTNDMPVVRVTATELDSNETAATGNLYSRDALGAGAQGQPLTFEGSISATSDGALDWLDGAVIQVGGKRSLSLGLVRVEISAIDEPTLPPPAARSIVQLVSPAIIVDRFGAAALSQGALVAELSRVSGDRLAAVAPTASWIRTELIAGWHMQSALPKPADWAMTAGSCVVVSGLSESGRRRLSTGIGYRTAEGFGDIQVLDPRDFPNPPEPLGVVEASRFKRAVAQRHRGQALAAARKGLAAVKAIHASGGDPSGVIASAMRSVGFLPPAERAVFETLLGIDPAAIDDAIGALK
ncbi:hypothetical protein MLP_11330 [Microlunatus phosphovorus NM-1]|uniref:CRISPR-associated protein n=1 Tax=Microlunatus phosphovorus (strain ATCC 700054 / DSM 10555 / JCM 9379 / NBRC 101784 / NCIMB 13414 / VKM Ac-1990 / NM-1) TaxID=1032480 RepID=F5XNN3_MICPN|nr:hypothetical protein [Microlunatus phosphovorus]BAK34147.1 hypothetical protein MLP_11330 [Microlunatus phosphovorus NM-1]